MRGFGILVVVLIAFAVGIYIGGSLGVIGRPNDVYLQTDYDLGVIPYFRNGDRIHWLDPNKPLVNGYIAGVPDIYITSPQNPCKDLDSNGICTLDLKSTGTYTYRCLHCGDPTIPGHTGAPGTGGDWGGPGGDNGTAQGGDPSLNRSRPALARAPVPAVFTFRTASADKSTPAAAASGEDDSFFRSLYAKLARAFVSAFFTVKLPPGHPVQPDGHELPATNPPLTQAFVTCSEGNLTVLPPNQWFPPTVATLAAGTQIKWVSQSGIGSTFTVQNLPNSTDLSDACGVSSLASNLTGYTPACTLRGARSTVAYTIVDSKGKCKAPPNGFVLNVVPAVAAPPNPTGVTLPGLR